MNNKYTTVKLSSYQPIGTKTIQCMDCGCDVEVDATNNTKVRCDGCQEKREKELKKERNRRYYNNKNKN